MFTVAYQSRINNRKSNNNFFKSLYILISYFKKMLVGGFGSLWTRLGYANW